MLFSMHLKKKERGMQLPTLTPNPAILSTLNSLFFCRHLFTKARWLLIGPGSTYPKTPFLDTYSPGSTYPLPCKNEIH